MEDLGGYYTGIAALVAAIGHIIYTLYSHYARTKQAAIQEESEVVAAQGTYLESIARAASTLVAAYEERVSCLSQQLTDLQADYVKLRGETVELQYQFRALQADNRKLQDKLTLVEAENVQLRARVMELERFNGNKST